MALGRIFDTRGEINLKFIQAKSYCLISLADRPSVREGHNLMMHSIAAADGIIKTTAVVN